MDKKIKFLILIFVMSITACRKDEPIPDIKLSKTELSLEVGQGERIIISGGNGSYAISPGTTAIAELNLKGNALEITARRAGMQIFTITSADRKAALKLEVKEKPVIIPELGSMVGIYDLEGKALLVYSMVARSKGGLWLCESGADPYKTIAFLPYYREGEKKIVIKAEGFPSVLLINTPPEGREVSVVVERTTAEYIQVRSGNFRFVLERQK